MESKLQKTCKKYMAKQVFKPIIKHLYIVIPFLPELKAIHYFIKHCSLFFVMEKKKKHLSKSMNFLSETIAR